MEPRDGKEAQLNRSTVISFDGKKSSEPIQQQSKEDRKTTHHIQISSIQTNSFTSTLTPVLTTNLSPKRSPKLSPNLSIKLSPKLSPKFSPKSPQKTSPKISPKPQRKLTPMPSPSGSPIRTQATFSPKGISTIKEEPYRDRK